ncbi:hypothetical protein B0181_02735 [Moraxella caviae]|uniref:Uncharacterized protein conserved in bacteria n=1 Tax=Moraxella caviae TaxID=34060 RepID=A0A1T0A7T1_9GAMM|nr:endonuclease/exonuclease/phosphatase family protein [Moraxella caviae]OOR91678.1 hypothetical protein B0181_02735 [Moraxella caviae]STZ10403.1 Uncharacterized protein conserved in bacteria [Moraxella caviae]
MNTLKIVSYNIHKGMSPLNRLVKLDGMANALATLAPDVLCLQEVQGQNLKRAMAFNEYPTQSQHAWFGEYLQLGDSYGKNAEYEHGHHGNAVLSRFALDPKHNVNITVSRLEKRGVLHCEILPHGWGVPVVVLCAHLNLLEKDRAKQYQAIRKYIACEIDERAPLILAGDFNDWAKKSTDCLAGLGLVEVFECVQGAHPATFPAKLPLLSLDRIYVRNLAVHDVAVHSGAPWSDLSDHLPISAVVGLV